ncbi:MAG: MoaD/ThiS family protein [Hydrogenophaga sp.]|uniref:MoaD/ThiS family protein n=1 Tax=Hydrogenophaga sp. TaxID=1904254 RepID=UPI002715EC15|nr:MoaD/ThiS family protein [Hydrogenophaga sp.]MDO9507169.1 MoaD/ThiS family protein [Hydrogenophaga sp.]MDP2164856.1 MoaD/ThiS family protein [Hydrogenophaga sp.]MDP2987629.1 MoaD/ThiS family protein [Hydrogenophaga sp.]MDP3204892.1 MoaD/ThiS family protein [Hydrogenophaga sp.]MDP3629290.1 MoaD/ThiS family protein [Hydrogenophaga sp.]
MKVQLRYFASIREALGTGSETLDTQAGNLAALRAELVSRGGAYADALAPGRSVRVALNQTMSDEAASLTEGAEVGFFPPVTGG